MFVREQVFLCCVFVREQVYLFYVFVHEQVFHYCVYVLEQVFRCNYCGYETKNRGTMTYHVTGVHMKMKRFTCGQCGQKFERKMQYKEHMLRRHSNRSVFVTGCIFLGGKVQNIAAGSYLVSNVLFLFKT